MNAQLSCKLDILHWYVVVFALSNRIAAGVSEILSASLDLGHSTMHNICDRLQCWFDCNTVIYDMKWLVNTWNMFLMCHWYVFRFLMQHIGLWLYWIEELVIQVRVQSKYTSTTLILLKCPLILLQYFEIVIFALQYVFTVELYHSFTYVSWKQ